MAEDQSGKSGSSNSSSNCLIRRQIRFKTPYSTLSNVDLLIIAFDREFADIIIVSSAPGSGSAYLDSVESEGELNE